MTQHEIQQLLAQYRVIAVVGLSDDENKPSYDVAAYMQAYGYQIIPVNPFVEEVLGEKSYQSLLEIPPEIQKTIEIVDIFRRPADVLPVVEQAVALKQKVGKPYVVWMQLGIVNEAAAELARNAGLTVVMNKCINVEHNRLL